MPIPLTDDQAQALILAETGAAEDVTVAANLPIWWLLYSVKESEGAGLQYWYTRRAVLDYLLKTVEAKSITIKIGDDQVSGNQRFANLKSLRDEANAEILKIESLNRSGLTSYAPVSSLPSAYADYLKTTREM